MEQAAGLPLFLYADPRCPRLQSGIAGVSGIRAFLDDVSQGADGYIPIAKAMPEKHVLFVYVVDSTKPDSFQACAEDLSRFLKGIATEPKLAVGRPSVRLVHCARPLFTGALSCHVVAAHSRAAGVREAGREGLAQARRGKCLMRLWGLRVTVRLISAFPPLIRSRPQ